MNEQQLKTTAELAEKLLILIKTGNNQSLKREELKSIASDILHWQSDFMAYRILAEQAYRSRIRELMKDQELSFAAAENQAMTEPTYYIHKRTKYIYEMAEEKIRLLKIMLSGAY